MNPQISSVLGACPGLLDFTFTCPGAGKTPESAHIYGSAANLSVDADTQPTRIQSFSSPALLKRNFQQGLKSALQGLVSWSFPLGLLHMVVVVRGVKNHPYATWRGSKTEKSEELPSHAPQPKLSLSYE